MVELNEEREYVLEAKKNTYCKAVSSALRIFRRRASADAGQLDLLDKNRGI